MAKFRATPRCPDLDAASSAAYHAYIAHITSGVGQTELIHDLLCTLHARTAFFPYMVGEAVEALAGHLLSTKASPALCSALVISQPAWTKPSRWAPNADVPNTEQGENPHCARHHDPSDDPHGHSPSVPIGLPLRPPCLYEV